MLLALVVAGLSGLGFWVAEWKWPAKSIGATPDDPSPVQDGLPRRFKVATFNIHCGIGLDGQLDLKRTASCVNGMDFIGLNEVRGNSIKSSEDQASQLGELLASDFVFAPTEVGWWGPHLGQGALSRFPITSWQSHPFPRRNGNGYRNYLLCRIPFHSDLTQSTPAKVLTVLVTHLDRKSDRQDQLKLVIERFLKLPTPVILMGDLNSKRTEPRLQELKQQPGVIDCFGQSAKEPLVSKRIDWIFARGLKCLDANLEPNEASDHPWGWAELELPETATDAD